MFYQAAKAIIRDKTRHVSSLLLVEAIPNQYITEFFFNIDHQSVQIFNVSCLVVLYGSVV